MNVEGGEHASADGIEDHARNHNCAVVSDGGDNATSNNRAEDGGEEERENLDASLDGADSLDGLEIEGCYLALAKLEKPKTVHLQR